jgi:hypothetical protein
MEETPSLLDEDSTAPMVLPVPMLVENCVPLLSELPDEEPVVEEDWSLPPIPPPTLAEATPGTPPVTEAFAFQLSV